MTIRHEDSQEEAGSDDHFQEMLTVDELKRFVEIVTPRQDRTTLDRKSRPRRSDEIESPLGDAKRLCFQQLGFIHPVFQSFMQGSLSLLRAPDYIDSDCGSSPISSTSPRSITASDVSETTTECRKTDVNTNIINREYKETKRAWDALCEVHQQLSVQRIQLIELQQKVVNIARTIFLPNPFRFSTTDTEVGL